MTEQRLVVVEKNLEFFSRDNRRTLLDWEEGEMSIRHQADLLSLNRSGLYYVPRSVSPEEVAMKHRIDELYTKWPFYGSRRITACLRREDVSIARKRVQRYMKWMYLIAVIGWHCAMW